ncbi:hypothetical protein ACDF64_15980 [Agromyces sp. MMS24-JH15]|uniref:hypothetical protein n=1 Tax=Agromyces sp. MMS24-JH15 TaxID=3243765 RepID=UPI003748C91C
MRFVFAIVAFFAAAVMIGLGIAQRTVFLEPDRVALTVKIDSDEADYAVIAPDALSAHDGHQSLRVSGEGSVFLAYGRSSDVEAWIGEDPFVTVHYDAEAGELLADAGGDEDAETPSTDAPATDAPATTAPAPDASAPATPAPGAEAAEAVSPAGSDLWLDEITGDGEVVLNADVPDDVSVIVASGSADPLPDEVSIAWPVDNATPWAGPLITAGAIVFLAGIALLVSGILHHRRSRGPRRNLPKGPRPRLQLGAGTRRGGTAGRRSGGRRAFVAASVLVPALALSACSADYWPSFEQPAESAAPTTPAPTPEPTGEAGADAGEESEDDQPAVPAVTESQMETIMGRVAGVAADADAALDGQLAATRFVGPALVARQANYAIRAQLPDQAALPAIPSEPLTLTLPQQAKGWPRTVLAVANASDDPTVAPSALVLTQESPRADYRILYAMSLVPEAEFPEVAPASIGAPLISPEFKGLVLPPGQVAAAYADVLINGDASQFAALFDPEGDVLRQQLGVEGQAAQRAQLPPTATATYSNAVGDSPAVALATNDSGALVSVSIQQTEHVAPNDGGTIGFQAGAPGAALSGFTGKSAKGVQRVIGIQILFYIPSVGSDELISVLGWSESLIGASEIP